MSSRASSSAQRFATSLSHDGQYAEAQQRFEKAITLYKNCMGERHSLVATAIHNQAEHARKMGDLNEAERLYQAAIDLWSSALGPNHPYVARAIDGLAEAHANRARSDRAEALYERALQIRRSPGRPGSSRRGMDARQSCHHPGPCRRCAASGCIRDPGCGHL